MKTEIIEKIIKQYEEDATRWAYLLEVEPDLGISIEARAELAAIREDVARKDAALAVIASARDASTMEEALRILIEEGDPIDAALSGEEVDDG